MTTRVDKRRPTSVGLFAGIGGIELGLYAAGFETGSLSEIDPAARAVLEIASPAWCSMETSARSTNCRRSRSSRAASRAKTSARRDGQQAFAAGTPGSSAKSSGCSTTKCRSALAAARERALHAPARARPRDASSSPHGSNDSASTGRTAIVDARCFGLPQRRKRVAARSRAAPRIRARSSIPRTQAERRSHAALTSRMRLLLDGGHYEASDGRSTPIPTLKGGSTIGIPSPPAIRLPERRYRRTRHSRCGTAAGIRCRLDRAASSARTPRQGAALEARRERRQRSRRRVGRKAPANAGRVRRSARWLAARKRSPSARRRLQRLRKAPSGERLRMARARSIHTARGVPPAPDGGSLGACDGRLPRARAP